jgi:hypothetical protein
MKLNMRVDQILKNNNDNKEQILTLQRKEKNKLFLILDLIIMLLTITGVSLFQNQADVVLIIFWGFVGLYIWLSKRFDSFTHLIISTCIAFLWVWLARNNYGYNYTYFSVAGLNLLPIAAWSMGLLFVCEILNHLNIGKIILRLVVFAILYWCALIALETYAFHFIGIRNISTGNSNGLPLCNCIHAPWWMRIVYFSMGPVYYIITIVADRFTGKNRS